MSHDVGDWEGAREGLGEGGVRVILPAQIESNKPFR